MRSQRLPARSARRLRRQRMPGVAPPPGAGRCASSPRDVSPLLTAAAAVCTDFGRVHEFGELRDLLARAADVMDASGIVVWLGSAAGADLRPVLAHGYSDRRSRGCRRSRARANNAAAAAYRTGALQIVSGRPGRLHRRHRRASARRRRLHRRAVRGESKAAAKRRTACRRSPRFSPRSLPAFAPLPLARPPTPGRGTVAPTLVERFASRESRRSKPARPHPLPLHFTPHGEIAWTARPPAGCGSRDTKAQILERAEREKVKFMRLQFTDILGAIKNVEIPDRQFEEALDGKIMFDGSSIEGFVRIEESDMYLQARSLDLPRFPVGGADRREASRRMICDIYTPGRDAVRRLPAHDAQESHRAGRGEGLRDEGRPRGRVLPVPDAGTACRRPKRTTRPATST